MTLVAVRDIAIIVLAVESIIIGVLLILLLWQVRGLTRLLQEQIKPMLDSMQETIGRIKGTTTLVSETIVSPAVKISGFTTGVRRALEVMLKIKQPDHDEHTHL
jgi:hypothetical protein